MHPRGSRARHRLTTLLASVLLAGAKPAPAAEPPADLVVLNGKVLTADASFRTAEAVAVRDGVFVRVGANADVRALVGSATRVIDARGKSVVPGLIDSHVHALGVAAGEAVDPFRELRSVSEIQEWVREKASGSFASPPGPSWMRATPLTRWWWTEPTH